MEIQWNLYQEDTKAGPELMSYMSLYNGHLY